MWKFIFFCVFTCFLAEQIKADLKIGDICESDEDCEDIYEAVCNSNDLCECSFGYVSSSNGTTCLPLADNLGDGCEVPEQCSRVSAECLNNICVRPQAASVSSTTAKTVENCTDDSQCPSTFLLKKVCKNGACVLDIPISPANIPNVSNITLPGQPCSNDTVCAEGSVCIDKLCKCKEDHVLVVSLNLQKCLPKAKSYNDICEETSQCVTLQDAACENGKCVKKVPDSIAKKTIPLMIGSSCQNDNECKTVNHALCLENVCQCEDKYVTSITSNSCLLKAQKPGDSCEIDKQCEDIKEATCVKNKCVKPGVVGTKLGKTNSGPTETVSKLAAAAILFVCIISL